MLEMSGAVRLEVNCVCVCVEGLIRMQSGVVSVRGWEGMWLD